MYQSPTLRKIKEDDQPDLNIKCRTCIHSIWRLKNYINDPDRKYLTAYCKEIAETVYDPTLDDQVIECDSHDDKIPEDI